MFIIKRHTSFRVLGHLPHKLSAYRKKLHIKNFHKQNLYRNKTVELPNENVLSPFALLTKNSILSKGYFSSKLRFCWWSHERVRLICVWKQSHTFVMFFRPGLHQKEDLLRQEKKIPSWSHFIIKRYIFNRF